MVLDAGRRRNRLRFHAAAFTDVTEHAVSHTQLAAPDVIVVDPLSALAVNIGVAPNIEYLSNERITVRACMDGLRKESTC
jgi:hypothetical protein